MAKASTNNTLQPLPRPRLRFTEDGPGELSLDGPRHDNDHADFRRIQILPTVDEILAVNRPIYMPKKNLNSRNHVKDVTLRHIDLLFRQLRCDATEIIRDVCYSAAQVALLHDNPTCSADYLRHETVAGNPYFLYRRVNVEELFVHEARSLTVRLSYHCPESMRGTKMYQSSRLKETMLVAILEHDPSPNELLIHFMEIVLSQSTMSMDSAGGAGERAAVQLSFVSTCKPEQVLRLSEHAFNLRPRSQLFLVEFPNVLHAGFYNCLDRLQRMHTEDLAFSQYITPAPGSSNPSHNGSFANSLTSVTIPPPAYTATHEFTYNIHATTSPTSTLKEVPIDKLMANTTIETLRQESSLDDGQVMAFLQTLNREFAFTQGPPGCGKTFLGVELTKTLLNSRISPKPILLVCLTNHALDNFLVELRDAGVKNLLRVGSGSKEKWTHDINLNTLKRKDRLQKDESLGLAAAQARKKQVFSDLDMLCKGNIVSFRVRT